MIFADTTWWMVTMVLSAAVATMMGGFGWFYRQSGEPEHRATGALFWSLCVVWAAWALMHAGLILGDGHRGAWMSTALALTVAIPAAILAYRLFFNGFRKRRR